MITNLDIIGNVIMNFDEIIGQTIHGYFKYYKMEKECIEYINNNRESLEDENMVKYIISIGKVIEYGKSYFLNELIVNIAQMQTFIQYMNMSNELMNKFTSSDDMSGRVEELSGGRKRRNKNNKSNKSNKSNKNNKKSNKNNKNNKKNKKYFINNVNHTKKYIKKIVNNFLPKSQRGGGIIEKFILLIMTALSITIFINNTSLVQSSASLDYEVQLFQPFKNFDSELPESDEYLEMITKEYGTNVKFPEDKIYQILNLTKTYKPGEKSNFLDSIKKYFSSNNFNEKFITEMNEKVKELNKLSRNINEGLIQTCEYFVDSRDELLPIMLYQYFNDIIVPTMKEQAEEKTQEILDKRRMEFIEKQKNEIIKEEPTSIQKTTNFFSKMFRTATNEETKMEKTSEINIQEYNQKISEIQIRADDYVEEIRQDIYNANYEKLEKMESSNIYSDFSRTTTQDLILQYFKSICDIKPAIYEFNTETGILTLKNPAKSRYHLYILSNNVLSMKQKVIEEYGIGKDMYDYERAKKIENLSQLSQLIVNILVDYNVGIKKVLTKGTYADSMSPDEFFDSLKNILKNLEEPLKYSLGENPMDISKQATDSKIKIETENIKSEIEENIQKSTNVNLAKKIEGEQKNYDLVSQLSNIKIQNIRRSVNETLSYVTIPIDESFQNLMNGLTSLIRAPFNMINTGIDEASGSLMNITWNISYLSMNFGGVFILILALFSGLPRVLIRSIKLRLERRLNKYELETKRLQNTQKNTQENIQRPISLKKPTTLRRRIGDITRNFYKKEENEREDGEVDEEYNYRPYYEEQRQPYYEEQRQPYYGLEDDRQYNSSGRYESYNYNGGLGSKKRKYNRKQNKRRTRRNKK